MNRTQLYLAGLLLVQVVLIVILRSPYSGASAGFESHALIPGLEAITPTQVEILGKDDASIRLVRSDGEWRIESLGGFPADGTKVDDLLDQLEHVRVRRPVVDSGRYLDSFKVADDDNEGRVRVWDDASDAPDVDLILGSSPNFRTSHVRLAGEKAVYEARGLSPYDIQPTASTWIERELVAADADQVTGLTLTNESGSFELLKSDGEWHIVSPEALADKTLDQEKVDGLVRSIATARLSDAVGPVDDEAQGFRTPAATLVLRWSAAPAGGDETVPSSETTLWIGGKPEGSESERFVTREGFGFTGKIWESSVRRLLEEKVEQLEAS